MDNNTPVDPVAPVSTPKKRRFSGGIEPGQLTSGLRHPGSRPKVEEEPNVLSLVGKMSASDFKRWKKDPANASKLSAALRARKEQS